jgi:hypothetical protein
MQRSNGPANQPAAPGQYALRLVRVKEGQTCTFRMLSERYGGIVTHYYQKRSRYCPGKESCQPAIHRLQPQYRGYCAAEMWHSGTGLWFPCALELSEHAELDVRGRYARGTIWTFSRAQDVDEKPQPIVAHLDGVANLAELPNPFDYRDVIKNIYHVGDMRFDALNPLPPRILASPSAGSPPPIGGNGATKEDFVSAEKVREMYEAYQRKQRQGGAS